MHKIDTDGDGTVSQGRVACLPGKGLGDVPEGQGRRTSTRRRSSTRSAAMASFATGGYARGLQTAEMMHKIDTDSDGTVSHGGVHRLSDQDLRHDGHEPHGLPGTAGVSRQVNGAIERRWLLLALALAASASPRWVAQASAGDWTQFGWDVASSGASAEPTGITTSQCRLVAAASSRSRRYGGRLRDLSARYRGQGRPTRRLLRDHDIRQDDRDRRRSGRGAVGIHAAQARRLGGLAPDHQQHPGGRSRPQSHLCRRARRHDSKARRRGRTRALDDAHHPTAGAREDRLAAARIPRPHHRGDHGLHRGPAAVPGPRRHSRRAERQHSCTSGTRFAATNRDCSCRAPAPPRNPAFGAAPAR